MAVHIPNIVHQLKGNNKNDEIFRYIIKFKNQKSRRYHGLFQISRNLD